MDHLLAVRAIEKTKLNIGRGSRHQHPESRVVSHENAQPDLTNEPPRGSDPRRVVK